MVVRNETFVAPIPMGPIPREARHKRLAGKTLVETFGCRSTRQANRKVVLARTSNSTQPIGGVLGRRLGVFKNTPTTHLFGLTRRAHVACPKDGCRRQTPCRCCRALYGTAIFRFCRHCHRRAPHSPVRAPRSI